MFNRTVVKHSLGKKEASPLVMLTESVAASDFLDRKLLMDHHQKIERDVEKIEQVNAEKRAISVVVEHSLLESQLPSLINNLNKEGRDIIFKDILFEMFTGSLVLDQSIKTQEEYSLRALVESYVDDNGGYNLIKESFAKSKSPVLKAIMEACEAIAGKVCTRKMCECQNGSIGVNDIKFDLNDEEQDQLDYEKKNLNLDQLSDLVKSKVITVIKDEKSRQAKEEELQNDLKAQAEEDETTVEEAYMAYVIPGTTVGVEESTLFNSLFRNTYKGVLENAVVVHAGAQHTQSDGNTEDDMYVNSTHEDVNRNEFRPYTINDARKGYSIKSDMAESDTDGENPLDDNSYSLDMDLILAESITKYTLMEMAYTIKLEDYDYLSLQRISQRLLN